VDYFGRGVKVHAVTRPMAARWANDLQRDGLTKRYVANQVAHVAQLFQAQIRSGFLPQGQNPVKGLVTLSAVDKRQIRSSGRGWEPFELEALQKIFEPKNFARATQQHMRWGVLIGLYSGARVAEVAQIFLRDFVELDGTKCVYLTDDNDGASLKNDQSRRLVPLHPDLLALGLWDRVERLRAQGAERLFPDMKIDGKSGAGNAISKGFSYLLGRLEIKPRRAHGTLGFHSLRKNVIQQLQGTSLPAERRRALVGHEAGEDVHAKDYMRSWTAQELAVFFPGLPWGEWLKFDRLLPLLQS
jgi:integrase